MFVFPIQGIGKQDSIKLTLEKKGENLSYTIRILNMAEWEEYQRIDHLIAGFITGCYLLVFMIGMVLLYFKRQMKFLLFNAYVITSLGWFMNDAGLLFQFIWPEHPSWHNSSRGFFSSVTMAFFGSYLYQNPGSRILSGMKKAIYVLAGIIIVKISTGAMAATGIFPAAFKPFSMHLNAVSLGGLFGYIGFSLLLNLRKYAAERYEMLAIVIYSLFIFQLTMHELGFQLFDVGALHRMEMIIFFFVQIICMSLHLFHMEKQRRLAEAEHVLQITRDKDRILSEKLIEMEEQEKHRIARNIHDEIGSLFAAMKYRILSFRAGHPDTKAALDQLLLICNEGIEKQYSVVDDMIFHIKTGKDFEQAIREKFHQLFGHRNVALDFICDRTDKGPDEFQQIQLYRIITELMTNSLKHAEASNIILRLKTNERILITYKDDGPGFDATQDRTGHGLSNIINRVAYLQGSCNTRRDGDDDWIFIIEIPIRHE